MVTVGKADAMDVGYGVLFVTLGAGGLIHALWSRSRWLSAGGGPLPGQEEKVARYVSKYKPVLLWGGWSLVLLLAIAGLLTPKDAKGIPLPLVMGVFAILGTVSTSHGTALAAGWRSNRRGRNTPLAASVPMIVLSTRRRRCTPPPSLARHANPPAGLLTSSPGSHRKVCVWASS